MSVFQTLWRIWSKHDRGFWNNLCFASFRCIFSAYFSCTSASPMSCIVASSSYHFGSWWKLSSALRKCSEVLSLTLLQFVFLGEKFVVKKNPWNTKTPVFNCDRSEVCFMTEQPNAASSRISVKMRGAGPVDPPWWDRWVPKGMISLKWSKKGLFPYDFTHDPSIWVFPKIGVVFPPNHPFVHRIFHYFHHPFWGYFSPYFCFNTHI